MSYSQWQIQVIRNGLRRYYEFASDENGNKITWEQVGAKILVQTDVAIDGERLRQFVFGFTDPDTREQRFPTPRKQRLVAIAQFLMHDDVRALSANELKDNDSPPPQAVAHLLDFLDLGFDDERLPPPEHLPGLYEALGESEERGWSLYQRLRIGPPTNNGVMPVALTVSEIPSTERTEKMDEAFRRQLERQADGQWEGRGWAALSPEDTLMVFIKRRRDRENRYFLLAGIDDGFRAGTEITRLALLEHDYPAGPITISAADDELLKQTKSPLGKKVRLFKRAQD